MPDVIGIRVLHIVVWKLELPTSWLYWWDQHYLYTAEYVVWICEFHESEVYLMSCYTLCQAYHAKNKQPHHAIPDRLLKWSYADHQSFHIQTLLYTVQQQTPKRAAIWILALSRIQFSPRQLPPWVCLFQYQPSLTKLCMDTLKHLHSILILYKSIEHWSRDLSVSWTLANVSNSSPSPPLPSWSEAFIAYSTWRKLILTRRLQYLQSPLPVGNTDNKCRDHERFPTPFGQLAVKGQGSCTILCMCYVACMHACGWLWAQVVPIAHRWVVHTLPPIAQFSRTIVALDSLLFELSNGSMDVVARHVSMDF